MKVRRTNKVGKFEVKKVKNKGAVSKNVGRVVISPRSPKNVCMPERMYAYNIIRYNVKAVIVNTVVLHSSENF